MRVGNKRLARRRRVASEAAHLSDFYDYQCIADPTPCADCGCRRDEHVFGDACDNRCGRKCRKFVAPAAAASPSPRAPRRRSEREAIAAQ